MASVIESLLSQVSDVQLWEMRFVSAIFCCGLRLTLCVFSECLIAP